MKLKLASGAYVIFLILISASAAIELTANKTVGVAPLTVKKTEYITVF